MQDALSGTIVTNYNVVRLARDAIQASLDSNVIQLAWHTVSLLPLTVLHCP
jgi:hypothetical protein